MAATKTLAAAVRSGTGKGAARSVRREGRVPAVIYGGGDAAEPISLDHRETHKQIYAGHFLTTIFEIDIEGRKERVIPRDYQLDRVKDTPVHVDFLRLRPGSKLRLEIPVHLVNLDQAPGIKRGGTLNIVRHTVEMLVPADAIPESITGDLAGLDINGSLHISACDIPEGCVPVHARPRFHRRDHRGALGSRRSQCRRRSRRSGRRRQGRRRCQGRQGRRRHPPPRPPPRSKTSALHDLVTPASAGVRLSNFRFPPCCSSSASAIPALNMPATGTISASWRSTRSREPIGPRRSAAAFPGSPPTRRSRAKSSSC